MAECSSTRYLSREFPQQFLQEIRESIEDLGHFGLGINVQAMRGQVNKVSELFMDRKQRFQALIDLPSALNQITSHATSGPVDLRTTMVYTVVQKWLRILAREDSDIAGTVRHCPLGAVENPGRATPIQEPLLPPLHSQPLSLAGWVSQRPSTRKENSLVMRNDRKTLQKVISWWLTARGQLVSNLNQQEMSPIKKGVLQIQLEAFTLCLRSLKEMLFSPEFIFDFWSEIDESIDYLGKMGLGVDTSAMHHCVESFSDRFRDPQQRVQTLQGLLEELEKITGRSDILLKETLIRDIIQTWILMEDPSFVTLPVESYPATMNAGSLLPPHTSHPLSLVEWKSSMPKTGEESCSLMGKDAQSLQEVITWWSTVEEQLNEALKKQEISSTKKGVLQIQKEASQRCFSELMGLFCSVDQKHNVEAPCTSASSSATAPSVVGPRLTQEAVVDFPLEDYLLDGYLPDEEVEDADEVSLTTTL